MSGGVFYGIGVGPGDPELLTFKAVKVLQEAGEVFVPRTGKDSESTALSVVKEHLKEKIPLHFLTFPMTRDRETLEWHWREGADRIEECLKSGDSAAFLTLGDPMLYSTYVYLFKIIKERGYPVETIPGVTSFCAAAAAADFPLVEGEEKMVVLPWQPGEEEAGRELLGRFDSAVLMKVSSDYGGVLNCLQEVGLLENSVLVKKCGQQGESVEKIKAAPECGEELPYFSLILARKKGEQF